ncbi:MAG: hypothetical protein IIA19_01610 [Thaumarchaeota archaeon]|nr:hypothetical protein [Nitrososphaerota archaeon]
MIKKSKCALRTKLKCAICSENVSMRYNPMEEWSIDGVLCGDCYSKKLSEYYPGIHKQINKK